MLNCCIKYTPVATIVSQEQKKSYVCQGQNTPDATKDPRSLCGETQNKYESLCLTRDGFGKGCEIINEPESQGGVTSLWGELGSLWGPVSKAIEPWVRELNTCAWRRSQCYEKKKECYFNIKINSSL